jgi:hypothetical protein
MVMKQRLLFPVLLAVLGFCSPAPASAQQPAPARQAAPDSQDVRTIDPQNAEQTREDLRRLLQLYPQSVGEVLRRDPVLMGRADYMASYPRIAEFIAQHPEVARNAEFYFEGYGSWQQGPSNPSVEALGVLLGALAGIFVFVIVISVMVWLVRSFIQHRRWLKTSQIQTDVHTKLMERMHSNEELLAYVQSPAGRRFLESAPIKPEVEAPQLSAPIGSIIWSLMAGVVLTTVGVGLRYSANFIEDEAQQAFVVVGVVVLSLGIGFILASVMAYVLSSRLGLFPQKPAESQSQSNA